MSRTARLWKGAGLLTLGGVLLSGVVARGDDNPPLAAQLNDLGRQALAQGASAMAQTFFQKALSLDPGNATATRGLKDAKAAHDRLVRVSFQDPAPGQGATPPPAPAATPPPAPAATPPPAPGVLTDAPAAATNPGQVPKPPRQVPTASQHQVFRSFPIRPGRRPTSRRAVLARVRH